LTKYVADGEQYRTFMKNDLQQGNALLYEKYQWIKQHIFSGVEFRQDNEPIGRIIPLPTKQNLFVYTACTAPSKSKVPSISRPIGVGYIAEGGNFVSLEVGTYRFEEPMDLYFLVVSLTPGTPIGIFTVHPDSSLQPISAGLVPWISDTKGPVNKVLFGDIPKSIFPKGIYILVMLAVPVNNPVNNYMWVTNFIIP
jgi:hypothetical protein